MNGKRLISFALWGDNPLYVDGAVKNAERKNEFYPDWICRFYHDDTVPQVAIDRIKATGAELVLMGRTDDVLGMYWRFHPMFDDRTVERFIVRDTDSFFSQREVLAVNEWIESGKPFHIIRDCESHQTQILGGTWGAIPGCIPNFGDCIANWMSRLAPDPKNPRGLYHGSDQMFLTHYVWPVVRDNHIAHVRAEMPHLHYTGREIQLPKLTDGHYVGMVY